MPVDEHKRFIKYIFILSQLGLFSTQSSIVRTKKT